MVRAETWLQSFQGWSSVRIIYTQLRSDPWCTACLRESVHPVHSCLWRGTRVASNTLVLAWGLCRLKSFPSLRNWMYTPLSQSLKALSNIAANRMENKVGAKIQPCFTPLLTSKGSEASPFSWILACMLSWKEATSAVSLSGHPDFCRIFHRPLQFTVLKALVRSTNTRWSSWFYSRHFSCSWGTAKTMSLVPLPAQNPHCDWGTMESAMCVVSLLRMTLARIFPAMQRGDILEVLWNLPRFPDGPEQRR